MFGLGMPEILLILAIALMVIGPKKLPELAKTLGRAMGEFKKAAQDFKNSIDLESSVKEFEKPIKNVREELKGSLDPSESVEADGKKDSSASRDEKIQTVVKPIDTKEQETTMKDMPQEDNKNNQTKKGNGA